MDITQEQLDKNPTAAKLALDIIARSKKPPGWSRRSNSPYYTAKAAQELKVVLDDMLTSSQDMLFPVNEGRQRSINSIYLRVNQAFRYLMDYLDKDGVYAKLNECVRIRRVTGLGVRVEFINGESAIGAASVKIQKNPINRVSWKDALEGYIESAQPGDDPLVIDNIVLTPSQIDEVKQSFLGLTGFIHSVTARTIKVIRLKQ